MKNLVVVLAILLSVSAFSAPRPGPSLSPRAYFVLRDSTSTNEFVILLRERAKIRHARAILAGRTNRRPHVSGLIVKRPTAYNPRWSYHLAPRSIEFFDVAIEVCDANMVYIEEHLSDVGGAFLPGNRWCPWSSTLVREIRPAP